GDDSLVVVWEKRGCREETSYVTEYLVRYCPSSTANECIGDKITVNVSSDVTSARLPHLARSTKYLVHVVAASSAGLGPPSDDIWHMIEPEPPDEDISGLIAVVLAIISVVFLLTGCFCFIRYCYRQKQKIPSVSGLLEVQPTQQKCHPVNHYRGRPLPAPPEDVFVDHHTYGTSSDRTSMNNLGYEKVTHLELNEGISSNIPLLADHANMQHRGDGEAAQSQSVQSKTPDDIDKEVSQSHNGDSIVTLSNYIQRDFSPSTIDRKNSLLKMTLAESSESCNTESPAAYSWVANGPNSQKCPENCMRSFSSNDTLPLRSHWSVTPEAFHLHTPYSQNMDQNCVHIPDYNRITPNYVPSQENCFSAMAYTKQHHRFIDHHPSQPWMVAVDNEEFCTCGSDSEDVNSVSVDDNMSPSSKEITYPIAERKHSIPIDSIFATIPPPACPPSPLPPYDNAPPLPTDCESRFSMNHRQERFTLPVAMGSQEYLEPRVPPGYVSSVTS
ncbi:hypothetical protein EGW08_004423, partial [Elysia chlorotica]